jgi:alcohol dehydrogenase class IV
VANAEAPDTSIQPGSVDPTAFDLGRLPRIHFGAGRADVLPAVIARHGRRALLVAGVASFLGSERHARLEQALTEHEVTLIGPVVVRDEPSPALVDEAVAEHRDAAVDVVVGIGGGSVLDAAKAVAGLLRTGTSVRDHLEGVGPGIPYPGPAAPFVAVPTTAGTGSEATRNAVLSERGPRGFKRSFRDEALVPADAVVDPDLLAGASPQRIAANGMDAVTQLLESFVSLRASPVTDALALSGLAAARDGLLAWHRDPGGPGAPAARSRMAYAALTSGICLAHAGLGAVHGLASPLGALFPVPHGTACGAVLAVTTQVNIAALERRDPASPALARYATAGRLLADGPERMDDEEARGRLVVTLQSWTATLGIPGLGSFGVGRTDIPAVVADSRGSSMRTNPILLTDDEITDVLQRSL